MSHVLPEGWVEVPIGEGCELNPPKPRLDCLPADAPVSFVPMPAVDARQGAITVLENRSYLSVRKGYTSFKNNDVIFAKITPCMENGKAAIANHLKNGLAFGSTEFHVLRSCGATEPGYLFHYVRQESFRREAEGEMTGSVGQKRVPIDFIRYHRFLLPPLAEQKRIVDKVEALLARVNAARDRLEKIPAILKRFRQSVLAAACSGRLTKDTCATSIVGAAAGADLDPELLNVSGIDQLPASWSISTLDQLKDPKRPITYGVLKPGPYIEDGVPLARITDLDGDLQDIESFHRISQELSAQYKRTILSGGEVIVSLVGTIGKVGLVPPLLKQSNLHRNLALIAPREGVSSKYLYYILSSPLVQRQISHATGGANQPLLNLGDLRRFVAPVPPLKEQQEIVRRVESLFALADKIEERVQAATKRVEKTSQAVLASAFRGQLVPTEAELARQEGRDYEPASVLLERIKAERAAHEPQKGRKRGVGRKARQPKPRAERGTAPPQATDTGGVPQRILDAMNDGQEYSRADILDATGISTSDWTWAIRQLKEVGKVVQSGERRGARYARV